MDTEALVHPPNTGYCRRKLLRLRQARLVAASAAAAHTRDPSDDPFAHLRIGQEGLNAQFRNCPVVRYNYNTGVHSVHVRTSSVPVGMDACHIFTQGWSGNDNLLGTDFWIYDSLDDAQADINRWGYCNYGTPGVGYPRDCGRQDYVAWTWFSMPNVRASPAGNHGASFELFTGSQCPSPVAQ
tara:strand:- start:19 stop:567 length:549 start_codon:yes stop_codon:yes gene_type:complete